jgi:hypothetical protein
LVLSKGRTDEPPPILLTCNFGKNFGQNIELYLPMVQTNASLEIFKNKSEMSIKLQADLI